MPIYEYKCADCGHVTELLERPDEQKDRDCEECGSTNLERAFSAFSPRMAPTRAASSCDTCPTGGCPLRRN